MIVIISQLKILLCYVFNNSKIQFHCRINEIVTDESEIYYN